MSLTTKDITLEKFLETFTPQFLNEQGKQVLSNELFIQAASILKIDTTLHKILRRFK